MEEKDKIQDLESVERWGEYYLEHAETVFQQGNLQELEDFRGELMDFVSGLRDKWMKDKELKLLKPQQQQWFQKLLRKLSGLEILVASHIVVAQRDQELLREMDNLAFPEDVEIDQSRDFSGWSRSSLSFPDSFVEALATAKVPGGQ
jgi:hypothetical protein